MFKIISVGWKCAPFIQRTLDSVIKQTVQDWQHIIIYDGGDAGDNVIANHFSDYYGKRDIQYKKNITQQFAVRNQYEAICLAEPEDEDIIVFLDIDGDQLAHPQVFEHLLDYYSDGTLLTYGNYEPIPFAATAPPAIPFPDEVIAINGYRKFILNGGATSFNHLRTMKGKVAKSIPENRFKWSDGKWYEGGTDYVFMINGLELAGPRHKCIEEVLLHYNHANPLAEYLYHPIETSSCVQNALQRSPLQMLP